MYRKTHVAEQRKCCTTDYSSSSTTQYRQVASSLIRNRQMKWWTTNIKCTAGNHSSLLARMIFIPIDVRDKRAGSVRRAYWLRSSYEACATVRPREFKAFAGNAPRASALPSLRSCNRVRTGTTLHAYLVIQYIPMAVIRRQHGVNVADPSSRERNCDV